MIIGVLCAWAATPLTGVGCVLCGLISAVVLHRSRKAFS
jgi:nitrogenase subunit NifH